MTKYTDDKCKDKVSSWTRLQSKVWHPEQDSAGWYYLFCTDETFTDKRVVPPMVFEWGKCTEHP